MTIPVFRHNLDLDDWEVASVYASDDCDSMGRSAYDDSSLASGSLDDAALHLQGPLHDDTRFRFGYPMPQPSAPARHQNYPPPYPRPRRDARPVAPVAGKGGSVAPPPVPIVPPPGVIFPPKDRGHPMQDAYWPSTAGPCDMPVPVDVGPMDPPPPPLLLAPPSPPPRTPSPLVRRPSPSTPIAHGHGGLPYPTPVTVTGFSAGTGPNVNTHASSPIKVHPPPYHELNHVIPPRLADGGCQAHSGRARSPPRRSGHDVLPSSTTAFGAGVGHHHGLMARGPQSGEENMNMHATVVDAGRHGGRSGGSGTGVHHNHTHHASDRPDLHPPSVPSKYEYERDNRMARPRVRERRPSIWERFVRRFSPSRVQ